MRKGNPREWFRERFCKFCQRKECQQKGTISYPGKEDLLPCILVLVLMGLTERESLKEYRKKSS